MDYFDLHCDTAYECYKSKQGILNNNLAVCVEKGKGFDGWSQVFALWIKDDTPEPFLQYKKIINYFKEQLKSAENTNLQPLFALEGGAAAETLYCLDEMKADGIKSITLTWNEKNKIASGANEEGGLTDYGEQVIEKMNDLKIATDLSHLNRESFFDAVSIAKYPIATHSNCYGVYAHKRNLTDAQLIKIAEKQGIIGVCPYPEFSGMDSFEGVLSNILYMRSLGLENNIAFGSDFDGAKMSANLSDVSKVKDLFVFLRKNGISYELCERIFYENAKDYFEKL